MRLYWFRVHYPNGARLIQAFSLSNAHYLAQEKWGISPAHVEQVKDSEI